MLNNRVIYYTVYYYIIDFSACKCLVEGVKTVSKTKYCAIFDNSQCTYEKQVNNNYLE